MEMVQHPDLLWYLTIIPWVIFFFFLIWKIILRGSIIAKYHVQVILAYGSLARSTSGSQKLGVLTKRYDNSLFVRS